MDPDSLLIIVSFIFFLLLSAFFSSAETAFTAINKVKLRSLIDQKAAGAETLAKILERPKRLLTALLLGNNIANVGASALATAVTLDTLHRLGVENFALGMAVITGIMTFILLIFGEITPKTFAYKSPVSFALMIQRPVYLYLIAFHPIIVMFTFITRSITRVMGLSLEEEEGLLTSDEIKSLVKMGEEEGVLEKGEKDMIHSIFEFSETVAREIMTPRPDAVCVECNTPLTEVIKLISKSGHSRIPVFEEKVDNIVGIIYAKDLLVLNGQMDGMHLKNAMREAVFIPETKNIEDLFHQMKKEKFHMAIVADEYGGMSGLVTLEDIIEEIIGEIQDEYDADEVPDFTEIADNRFLFDAGTNIDDFAEQFNLDLPEDGEFDTLGGFVLSLFGDFPKKNDTVSYSNLDFKVKEIRKRRLITLEVSVNQDEDHPLVDTQSNSAEIQ